MDFVKILAELRQEGEQLQEAILVIEHLAMGQGKPRGRPPAWMAEAQHESASQRPRKKRVVTPEARAKMAAAQKRRWEAYRKAQQ